MDFVSEACGLTHDDKNRGQDADPKPQPIVVVGALGEEAVEGANLPRDLVRITSYRCRPVDPDNLVGGCKYAIDALRYAGVIQDDRQTDIQLQVFQVKTKTKKEEKTVIEVTYSPTRHLDTEPRVEWDKSVLSEKLEG